MADSWGETALHYLARRRKCKTVELVLESLVELGKSNCSYKVDSKLNVNVVNGEKETFLHVLLRLGEHEFVRKLINKYKESYQFDITAKNAQGQDVKVTFVTTA